MSNSTVRASKLTSLSTSVRVSPAPNPLQTVFVLTATLFIYFGFCYAPFLTLHPRGENSSSVLRGVGALTLTPTFPCQPARYFGITREKGWRSFTFFLQSSYECLTLWKLKGVFSGPENNRLNISQKKIRRMRRCVWKAVDWPGVLTVLALLSEGQRSLAGSRNPSD